MSCMHELNNSYQTMACAQVYEAPMAPTAYSTAKSGDTNEGALSGATHQGSRPETANCEQIRD